MTYRGLPAYRPDYDNPLYELYDDPATPWWARHLIADCLQRDPVDVAKVLRVLADAFEARTARILEVPHGNRG